MENSTTWVMILGEIGLHTVIDTDDEKGRFQTEDGLWHQLPPVYSFRGTRQQCIDRVTADINKFFDSLEKA